MRSSSPGPRGGTRAAPVTLLRRAVARQAEPSWKLLWRHGRRPARNAAHAVAGVPV